MTDSLSLSHLAVQIDRAAVLAYFKGKPAEKATQALDNLTACLEAGYWLKGRGGARGVVAGLDKSCPVAKKTLVAAGITEDGGFGWGDKRRPLYWDAYHALTSSFQWAPRSNDEDLAALGDAPIVALFKHVKTYRDAFAPIVVAIEALNRRIPPPVITQAGASPTVTRTLASLGATAVSPCPMERKLVRRKTAKGDEVETLVWLLKWPEGTRHNTSRYSSGHQCQACGHAIRNGHNWAPLVLTTDDGPKSLWVGHDCARTLFGVDYSSGLEIEGGKPAA